MKMIKIKNIFSMQKIAKQFFSKLTIITIIISVLVLSLFSGASAGFSQISTNNAVGTNSNANTPVNMQAGNLANTAVTPQIDTAQTNFIDVSGPRIDTAINLDLDDNKEGTADKDSRENRDTATKTSKITTAEKVRFVDFNKRPDLTDIVINAGWDNQDNTPKPSDSGSPEIEAFNYEKPANPTTAGGVEIKPYYPTESDALKCTIEKKSAGFKFVWKVNDKIVSSGSSSLENKFKDNDVVVCEAYAPTPFGDQYLGRGMVKVVNSPIRLDSYSPKEGNIHLYKNEQKRFAISVKDSDNENINFKWSVDGKYVYSSTSRSMSEYVLTNNVTGKHKIMVEAFDGSAFNKKSLIKIKWNFEIIDKSPSFGLISSPNPVLEGDNVTFTLSNLQPGTANDPIRKIEWDFGDKSYITRNATGNAEDLTAVHSYSKQGTYNVKVVVTDMDSSVIKYDKIVVNDAQPAGNLTASPTNILEGQNVTFGILGLANGSSADRIRAIYWDFGDGKTSNGQTAVSHQYTNQGKYKAVLRIVDEDSEKSHAVFIYVNDTSPVINDVLVSNTPVDEGSNVIFGFMFGINPTAGSNVETIKKYEWDFGDNSSIVVTDANTSTVNHTYIDNGTYVVSLKVWDSDSFTGTTTGVLVNDVNPSGNINTTATYGRLFFYYADVGELINFSVSGLANGSSTDVVKSIEWNMGNGVNFTTDLFSYAYPLNGTYNVTLKISDEDSFIENLIVMNISDVNPSGDFELENKTYYEGDNVIFNAVNISSGAVEDPVANITWDFGDGGNATGQSVNYTYADNGTYTVTMAIHDSNSEASVSHDIAINDVNPKGNISLSKNNVGKLENVHFSISNLANGSATDTIKNIEWYVLGNDFNLNKVNITEFDYNFSDDQNYSVVLRISDEDSFVIDRAVITVNDVQPAGAINSVDKVNEGDVVGFGINGFVNNSNDPVTSIVWDFGDGIVNDTDSLSVSHVYQDNGTYLVVLAITDSDSIYSANKTITVDDVSPFGIATANSTDVFEGELVGFDIINLANGSSTDAISGLDWNADDGFNSILKSFSHAFNSQGVYNVTLDIADEDSVYRANNLTINVKDTQPDLATLNIPLTGFEGEQLNFTSAVRQVHDNIVSIVWDFGDSVSASGENSTHVYAQNGSYLVKLTITDTDSSFSVNQTVNIADSVPTADFSFLPANPNASELVVFNSTVTGYDAPLSYSWDFGDGSAFDTNQNTTHNYTADGYYIINFKVTDADGSAVNVSKNITIGDDNGRLINSFLDLIYYLDNSTLTINGLDYSLIVDSNLTRPVSIRNSNVNSSVLVDVNITTSNLVDVTATDSNIIRSNLRNCTILRSTVIDVVSSDCSIIDSYVDPSNTTGSTITGGSVINSNVTYSVVDNSTITSSNVFNSQFEDSIVTNANITNDIIYWGNITTSDGNTYNVDPTDPPIELLDIVPYTPNVAFTVDSNSKQINVNFNFDASTTTDKNFPNESLNYNWDFDDTTTGIGLISSHAYTFTGTYSINLTVTDRFGKTNSTTQTITVTEPPAVTPSSPGPTGGGGGSSGKIYEIKELFTEKRFDRLKAGDEIAIKIDNFWYKVKILGLGSVMDFRFSPGDAKYYLNKTSQVNISLNDAKNLGIKYEKWDGSYGAVVLNLYDKKAVSAKESTAAVKNTETVESGESQGTTEGSVDVNFGEKNKEVEVSSESWYDRLSLNISKKKLVGAGITAGIIIVGVLGYFSAVALFGGNSAVSSTNSTKKSNGRKKRNGR